MSEIRCNNCMLEFESEDDLVLLSEDNKNDTDDEIYYYKGCPDCKTDEFLMNLE